MTYLKIAVIIFIFFVQTEASEKDVLDSIFEGYDPRIRPIKNMSLPVTVYIQPKFLRLIAVDTQQEYIDLIISVDQTWKDEFLGWDPVDYNGTSQITVTKSAVWLPDTYVTTTSFAPQQLIDDDKQMVKVTSDGTIFLSFPFVLSNYCEMKTDEFPYDQQQCLVKVSSCFSRQMNSYSSHYQIIRLRFEINSCEQAPGSQKMSWSELGVGTADGRYIRGDEVEPVVQQLELLKQQMKYLKIAVIIFIFFVETEASEKDVLDSIFEGYDTRIRPIKNASLPVTVYIQPQFIRLIEVDTQHEYIEVIVSIDQTWKDEFLVWDPADYNGTDEITVTKTAVWLPDMSVTTTSSEARQFVDDDKQLVKVTSDGTILLSFPFILSNYCAMKTDEFPYDQQQCLIKIASWLFSSAKLIFKPLSNNSLTFRYNNSEWNIWPITSQVKDTFLANAPHRQVVYTMTIQRKPAYFFWVLIMPTLIITALSIAGIFAPHNHDGEREEKVTLGLTTLLTLAVILSMVTDEMPRTTNLPLLGQFVMVEIVIIVVCMTISVIILFLHQRTTTRHWLVPRCVTMCLVCCRNKERNSKVNVNSSSTKEHDFTRYERNTQFQLMVEELKSKVIVNVLDASIKLLDDAVVKINDYINKKENERKTEEDEELRKEQWLMLFDHVDLLLFVFFQVIHVLVYLTMYYRPY